MKPKSTFMLLCCFFVFFSVSAQGKLNRAKSDLSEKNSTSRNTSDARTSKGDFYQNDVSFFDGVFIEIAYHATIGILFGEMQPRYFYRYPYADGSHGEYAFGDENTFLRRNQLTVSTTFFSSGNTLYGNDTDIEFKFIPLLGIEANHIHFFERDPSSELGLTSVMLNYYRVREKFVTAYWGVGATYIGNGVNEIGFSYQLGMQVFLPKPYSIEAKWKQSFINNTSTDELLLQVHRHLKKFSIYAGFRHYQLGSVSVNTFGFGTEYHF